MASCCICHRSFTKRLLRAVQHFYITYRRKDGSVAYKHWCSSCEAAHPERIAAIYQMQEAAEKCYSAMLARSREPGRM